MHRWLVVGALCVITSFSACGRKIVEATCSAFPPNTFSDARCQQYGAEAKCEVTRRDTTSLPDGGLSTSCHHENCDEKPTCPLP